jgi:AcrR family transcriptional regulator
VQKPKKEEKIDVILSSTIQLLAEKGYNDTSIADIASRASPQKPCYIITSKTKRTW